MAKPQPEEKTDLRVKKTRRAIMEAFLELAEEKPLDKIRVAELCARAEINKSTFYLHYNDIYDLFGKAVADLVDQQVDRIDFFADFFDDPDAFASKFMAPVVADRPRDAKPPARSGLMRPENLRFMGPPIDLFLSAFMRGIYATGRIEQTPENNGKLRFVLAGAMGASRFSVSASSIDKKAIAAVTQTMANCIRTEFPQSARND